MNKDRGIRVMTMALLLAAAGTGTALAQHVVGGMGEPVRMGAFDGRGQLDSQAVMTGPVSAKHKARARTTDARRGPAASTRGGAQALPGRHLP
ncbi:MAG: hypothetical protein JO278_16260 [Dyella sp.]|nr:hypothetical protein [Dyella sp.]